jgi:hypothetical protein
LPPALAQNGAQNTPTITQWQEMTLAVSAGSLDAGNFDNPQVRAYGAAIELGLDLEAITLDGNEGDTFAPKGVEAVAEVAKMRTVEQVRTGIQQPITDVTYPREIFTAAAREIARPFHIVGIAAYERRDEEFNLMGVG